MRRFALGAVLVAVLAASLIGAALATAAQLGTARPVEAKAAAESVEEPTVCTEAELAEATEAEEEDAECPAVEPEPEAAAEEEEEGNHEKVRRGSELAAPEAEAQEAKATEAKHREEQDGEATKEEATEEEAGESEAEEAEATGEEEEGSLSSLDLGDGASTLDELEVPVALLPVYQACGTRYGISWEVLAAINKVETGFGTDLGPSSAGAEGWMQFMPSSWKEWGVDADGDGSADTDDPVDAICSAARYLAASGGEADIYDAVLAYNHADWYAREVLADARRYERVPANLVASLTALAEGSTSPVAGKATVSAEAEDEAAGSESEAATIDGAAGAEVRAVVDGTVAKAGESEARGRYVVLRDAEGDRFVYSRLGKVTVAAGDSVEAGDALGAAGASGALGFSIQPDASSAIDPSELLEIWKRGGVGAIYGVDAARKIADPTDAAASPGTGAAAEEDDSTADPVRALLMSASALRREVLTDPDLELPACVRRAARGGELARQTLAALEYLTGRGYEVGVDASTCEHRSGFALAIDSVDGKRVAAGQGSGTAAASLVRTVVAMDAPAAPQTVASATGIAAAETGGTTATAIELDYQPPREARIVDGDAVAPTDAPAAVQSMIAAANQIDDTPYIWGGGHGAWVSSGYDCSGSVSYVLHAAKLLASPETSGALASWGESGSGNWVTVYANAEHTYAVIAGLRWDTVGDVSGSGPRWHTGAAYPAGFTVRHPAGY